MERQPLKAISLALTKGDPKRPGKGQIVSAKLAKNAQGNARGSRKRALHKG